MNNDTKSTQLNIPYLSKKETLDTKPDHVQPKDRVLAVFDYWVDTCRSKGRPPVLDPKRRRKIVAALKMYDVDTLKLAIDGVVASPFHQGENDRGRVYDELTLILRDAEHIEEFLDYTEATGKDWKDE